MINAAIVGLGRWGRNLVDSVQGKSDRIRFVAGVLRHPENARQYADARGIALHSELNAVLSDPRIDAIVLATPHTTHAEQIIAAARAGKPVFTEKPFTLSSADAREALRAAAEHGITLGVGYNWRFQPALQAVRRMLDDGTLGKLLHIEGNFCGPSVYRFPREHWRQQRDEGPGGGMTGRGVHVVDAMLYLAGHVDRVYARSKRIALDYGIDDTTSTLFDFKDGATGYLGTVIATAETWRMQVFGSKGWVEVGDVEHLTTWQMRVCLVDPDDLTTHHEPQVVTFQQTSTERAELDNFADAVREKRALAVAGGDEEHGVAVLEAIIESAKTGETVAIGAQPSVSARRAASKSEPSIATEAKRLLERAGKAIVEVVGKAAATAAPARSRKPAKKKTPRRTAAKKSTRRANARSERRDSGKRTRSAAKKGATPAARRASAKKKAPRRK